jgi:hypothetical protein
VPVYWPGGARREDGVSLVCGSCTEREKAGADTAVRLCGRREGARRGRNQSAEYRRVHRPADRLVVAAKPLLSGCGGGAKGPAHQACSFEQLGFQEEAKEHAKVTGQAVRCTPGRNVREAQPPAARGLHDALT